MSNTETETGRYVVEMSHRDGDGWSPVRLVTDDRQYAEMTAELEIFKNSWKLVSKNF